MRILFDQGTPVPLRRHLPVHSVTTAFEQGWSQNAQASVAAEEQESPDQTGSSCGIRLRQQGDFVI